MNQGLCEPLFIEGFREIQPIFFLKKMDKGERFYCRNNSMIRKYSGNLSMKYVAVIIIGLTSVFESSELLASMNQKVLFSHQVAELESNFETITLEDGPRKIVVLPRLQGRIATSTLDDSAGLGYVEVYEGEGANHQIRGGSDRFWLGPETGPYSLFFPPGVEIQTENLKLQEAVSSVPYDIIAQDSDRVTVQKEVKITNYHGFIFEVLVERECRLFKRKEIETQLDIAIPDSINYVGFGSQTNLINRGNEPWAYETGLLSIWNLSAFHPSISTTVVIPLNAALDKVTQYFDNDDPKLARIIDDRVFYHVDGQYMNKIGVPVVNTKPIMGSYDSRRQLLTIITFNILGEKQAKYVNSVWDWSADPYDGEIIQIFNDGPELTRGQPFGPLYEMESSSAALELSPGQSQSHYHHTFHFQGREEDLNPISKKLLGLEISKIKSVFAGKP